MEVKPFLIWLTTKDITIKVRDFLFSGDALTNVVFEDLCDH